MTKKKVEEPTKNLVRGPQHGSLLHDAVNDQIAIAVGYGAPISMVLSQVMRALAFLAAQQQSACSREEFLAMAAGKYDLAVSKLKALEPQEG